MRCGFCAADLWDPEVRAMERSAPMENEEIPEDGVLAGRFLGATRESLSSGAFAERLAVLGAVLIAIGIVTPLRQPGFLARTRMIWGELAGASGVRKVALCLPLLALVAGIVVSVTRRLSPVARGWILVVSGGALFVGLGALGVNAALPEKTHTLVNLGILVAGAGTVTRMLLPTSREARWALIAGAAILFVGYLIPYHDAATYLPAEFSEFSIVLDMDLERTPLFAAYYKGLDMRAAHLFFLSAWGLLPLALVSAAAGIAWPTKGGRWDRYGQILRPIGWALVLYVPLAHALYAFNLLGATNREANEALLTRLGMILLAVPAALWVQFGAATIVAGRRARSEPAS
jgi:hypothetical protein